MNRLTLFLLTIIIFTAFSTMSAGAQKPAKDLLFHAPPNVPAAVQSVPNQPTITWERAVTINTNALPTLRTLPESVLTMNFFSDATIETVLDSVTAHSEERYVWRGHVFGQEDSSSITLAVNDGVIVGNIRCDEGYFQIRTTADGQTRVYEMNESEFPTCGVTEEFIDQNPPAPMTRDEVAADSSAIFDVMVVYTTEAKTAVGGTATMEALIDLAVDETNEIYDNSLINSQVRLVHQAEVVGYTQVSFNSDLTNVRNGTGAMAQVHTWRDTYGADLVALFIDDGSSCGLGYLNSSASSAFSATHYSCATGYFSFAHEMGHNMGCHHALPETTQGSGWYNYSNGWRWNGDVYRSVMAYSPGSRVNHFSNPDVTHMGFVTGQTLGETDEASNAATINGRAYTVANWRQTVNPTVPYSGIPTEYHFELLGCDIEVTDMIPARDGISIIPCGTLSATFAGVNYNLVPGTNSDDNLIGTSVDDLILGFDGLDQLWATAGNDALIGGRQDDSLIGDAGDNLMHGGDGGDIIITGIGNDDARGGAGVDFIVLSDPANPDNTFDGGPDGDALFLSDGYGSFTLNDEFDIEYFVGGDGDDNVDWSAATTQVFLLGNGGNDILTGGSGPDYIDGGADDDTLTGNDGADGLLGQGGVNHLHPGNGDDSVISHDGTGTGNVHYAPGPLTIPCWGFQLHVTFWTVIDNCTGSGFDIVTPADANFVTP